MDAQLAHSHRRTPSSASVQERHEEKRQTAGVGMRAMVSSLVSLLCFSKTNVPLKKLFSWTWNRAQSWWTFGVFSKTPTQSPLLVNSLGWYLWKGSASGRGWPCDDGECSCGECGQRLWTTGSHTGIPSYESGHALVRTKWRTDWKCQLWPCPGRQILLASIPICDLACSKVLDTSATSVAMTTLTSAFTLSN